MPRQRPLRDPMTESELYLAALTRHYASLVLGTEDVKDLCNIGVDFYSRRCQRCLHVVAREKDAWL